MSALWGRAAAAAYNRCGRPPDSVRHEIIDTTYDVLQRHGALEHTTAAWVAVALSAMFAPAHINLNYFAGISILFVSLALLLVTLVAIVALLLSGMCTPRCYLLTRGILLIVKLVLLCGVLGLGIWAGVIMIKIK